jgi:hypothetical protein
MAVYTSVLPFSCKFYLLKVFYRFLGKKHYTLDYGNMAPRTKSNNFILCRDICTHSVVTFPFSAKCWHTQFIYLRSVQHRTLASSQYLFISSPFNTKYWQSICSLRLFLQHHMLAYNLFSQVNISIINVGIKSVLIFRNKSFYYNNTNALCWQNCGCINVKSGGVYC